MSSGERPPRTRLPELDGLRGIAVLAVVLFHYTQKYHVFFHGRPRPMLSVTYGYLGVSAFFVISGFVIFLTIESSPRPKDFVVARFSKLFPAYWVCVAATFLLHQAYPLPNRGVSFGAALVNLTMIQELLGFRSVDGAYWSLQVEILFYALVLVLLVTKRVAHADRYLLVLLLLAFVMGRLPGSIADRPVARTVRQLFDLDWLAWFVVGIMLYRVHRDGHLQGVLAPVLLGIAFAVGASSNQRGAAIVLVVTTLAFALILSGHGRVFAIRPLVYFGTISYPLYLIHQNMGYVVLEWMNALHVDPNLAVLVALAIAIGVASLLTFGIERPALRRIRAAYRRRR